MANENRYYKTPFAESGNKTEIPDVSVGGAVGYDSGYGPDYELPQGSVNRKRIDRDMYNGMFYGVTKNLKQWQENLYPTWIEDDGDGVAFSYSEGMIVSLAGVNYISLEDSNQEEPGTGSKWSEYNSTFTPVLFPTLSEAINSEYIKEGSEVFVKERTSGNGGGAIWDVVLTSSVTPNTYNIVQSATQPLLSLVQRAVNGAAVLSLDSSITDYIPAIEAYAGYYDELVLIGSLPVSTESNTIENCRVRGVFGKTTLVVDGSFTTGNVLDIGENASLEDLHILGSQDAPDPTDPSWFTDVDGALALDGLQDDNGVKLRGNSSKLKNVNITNFGGFGVVTHKNNVNPISKGLNSNIEDCRIYANYGGIQIPEESEYLKFNNTSITWNVVGVHKSGGNNTFTGNNIDHNRVNFITTSGLNNSHGGITGGTMNHGKLAILISDDITVGEAISGVNMFDGGDFGIYIKDSIGVNIDGCNISRCNLYCSGVGTNAANPGVNRINGNTFGLHGVTYQTYRNWDHASQTVDPATPDNCILRGNYHLEGQEAKDGSGWDEVQLNDTIAPDSDGFTQQQTIAVGGTNNSRIVSGRPLDGTQYLGDGTQVGAIKIKLPVAGFNNSNVRMRITVRTSNRLGCKIDFNSFILAGGTWGSTVVYGVDGNNYTVRLGKDTDGKPLVYIGELNTSWVSSVVEVEFFSMHGGVYSESKNWKYNWEITQEDTAFENVSDEFGSDILGFDEDLNTIDYDCEFFTRSTATNNPDTTDGWCKTRVRNLGAGIRTQEFTTSVTNKLFIRSTQTGDAGWTAWSEK